MTAEEKALRRYTKETLKKRNVFNLEAEDDSRDTRDDNPGAEAGTRDILGGIHRNSRHASDDLT